MRNFERFQHYKDRNPVWIKLYNSIIEDYEFSLLRDATKLHLVLIWLLASRHANRIPEDAQWIAKRINATEDVDLASLISGGFLEVCEPASSLLATCSGSARSETETEGEKSREEPPNPPPGGGGSAEKWEAQPKGEPDLPGFDKFWAAWPVHRRKADKPRVRRKWVRLALEGIAEQVIVALGRWKTSRDWRKNNGDFIPAPLVWLNQERWKVPPETLAEQVGGEPNGNGFARTFTPEMALAAGVPWDPAEVEGGER